MSDDHFGDTAIDAIVSMFEDAEEFAGLDLDAVASGASPRTPDPSRSGAHASRPARGRRWPREKRWIVHPLPLIDGVEPHGAGAGKWSEPFVVAPFDRGAWPARIIRKIRWCARLDQSDTDNAKRLLAWFGSDLLVRIQEGGRAPSWVTWNGTIWDTVTGSPAAIALAQQVGDRIEYELAAMRPRGDDLARLYEGAAAEQKPASERDLGDNLALKLALDIRKAFDDRSGSRRKHAVTSKNGGRIAQMLAMAAPHVMVKPEVFNSDPMQLATPSQTLRFIREGDPECPDPDVVRHVARLEVREGHDRRDRITVMAPYDYDPKARCPLFDAFMARFQPDAGSRRFLQVAAGIGLLGVSPQVLVFLYGEGANGKSVFLEVLSRVFGALAAGLPAEAISGDDEGGLKPSPEIARLDGKRWVRISEVPEGTPLKEAFIKRITGSEPFPARNLFEGYYEFLPQFVPFMTGNGYPRVAGTDNGIWRRMRVVKWPVTLALEDQRPFDEVVDELVAEAPGIFAWLVEGALIFLREGLVPPPSVVAETQAYRDEMDSVGRFVKACVTVTGNTDDQVTGRTLHEAYKRWAEASGIRAVSETKFGRDIKKVKGIAFDESRVRIYRCITLHDVPPAEPRTPSDRQNDDRDPLSPW